MPAIAERFDVQRAHRRPRDVVTTRSPPRLESGPVEGVPVHIHGLDLDRLAALLPTGSTKRIGTADVAAIEHTTDLFRGMEFSRGGEMYRAAAVAQLGSPRAYDRLRTLDTDRDVTEIRGEIRDFRQSTTSSFNAMRDDLTDFRQRVDNGFTEMRGKLDAAAAGQQRIVDLLNTLIGQNAVMRRRRRPDRG